MTFVEWFWNSVSGLSQFLNSLTGGYPCETLSGRAYRTQSFMYKVVNAVYFWQDNHCRDSLVSDVVDSESFLTDTAPVLEVSVEVQEVLDTVAPYPEQKPEQEIEEVTEETEEEDSNVLKPKRTPVTNGMAEDGGQKFSNK